MAVFEAGRLRSDRSVVKFGMTGTECPQFVVGNHVSVLGVVEHSGTRPESRASESIETRINLQARIVHARHAKWWSVLQFALSADFPRFPQ